MYFFDYGFGDPAVPGAHDYPAFMTQQSKRRRIALVGANDGMLHAFEAGFWDRDRAGSGETYDEAHDLGTGTELFAWVPQAVMPRLWSMTYGLEQQYMVDGPTATGDVYIDLTPTDGTDDPEWRTIAISTMRRGGRGMVTLDITQPDPTGSSPDYEPTVSDFPGCRNGGGSCSGEYPRVMWEFEDTSDADTNCPGGLSGVQCAPYWDLGWTWSKPAIARIAVYNSSAPSQPDSQFVAFFGGGWDQTESDSTGNFFYGVDIETGNVVYKYNTSVSMPGSPTALDSDIDGFHDRIYFGDSDGSVWRLEFPAPNDSTHTGADAGTLTRIFDFRLDFPDRQRFYYRPVMVPALFGGSGYTWGIAMGTGDRPHLSREDTGFDHFYFLLDDGQSTAKGATDLVAVNYDELEGFGDVDGPCTSTALDPANGSYGWYLSLREKEKVMFDATVVNGHVLFPTFDPTDDVAAHNVPNQCGTSGNGGDDDGDGDGVTDDIDNCPGTPEGFEVDEFGCSEVSCNASGLGRFYDLWFTCGLGEYTETNDIITGSETYTIGGTTYVSFTGSNFSPPVTEEFPNATGHVITNWRQE